MKLPPFDSVVNKPFAGLLNNRDRLILLWGGRGSGKSIAAIRLVIYRCLLEPYFKCILIRKVYDTVKDSMFEAIKDEVDTLGLNDFFTFTEKPMQIKCINGNVFLGKGLDKPDKLKSIKEPSMAWYEEGNQITEQDFITVTTSIRGQKARFLQEVFSFNPETDGANHDEYWLYKKFFAGRQEKTFRDSIEVMNPVSKELIQLTYTSVWSTYHDNPHVPPEFIATLETMKRDNPYYYQIYALGLWGNRDVDNPFYKCFSMDLVKYTEYIDYLPLHISFDENVNPYLTLTVHQVIENHDTGALHINQIDEICLPHPRNTLRDTCNEFAKRFRGHTEGLFIYGDRTSVKQDVKLEKGQNFFTMAREELKDFRPSLRIPSVNPNVKSRGDFINSVFAGRVKGVEISFNDNCSNTINDYLNLIEAADGTKHKQKTTDKRTKVSYEKYGHTSDANDYLYIQVLKTKYNAYISGNKRLEYKMASRASQPRKNRM